MAWEILRAAGLRSRGPEIVSYPTCGRTEIDLIALASAVEDHVQEQPRRTARRPQAGRHGLRGQRPRARPREADLGLAGDATGA